MWSLTEHSGDSWWRTLQELPEDGAPVLSMEDPELEAGPRTQTGKGRASGASWNPPDMFIFDQGRTLVFWYPG